VSQVVFRRDARDGAIYRVTGFEAGNGRARYGHRVLKTGTLYTALGRLREAGWIEESDDGGSRSMSVSDPVMVRVACRIYAGVICRLVRDRSTAEEMERTFRALSLREHAARGVPGLIRRTGEELLDLARNRPAEAASDDRGAGGGAHTGYALAHAWRSVRRRPGYAAAFIVTMGAGIGINAAMLTVVGAVALRDLPYNNADRLAQVWSLDPSTGRDGPTVPAADFLAWREHTDVFETLEGFGFDSPSVLTGLEEPRQVMVARVTTGLFGQLGVAPVRGRSFQGDEGLPGGPSVVMLGHGLWSSAFGSDSGIVGGTIRLGDVDYTVIGVMPPGFAFPFGSSEAWLPIAPTPTGLEAVGAITGLAHLRVGLTREQAETRLTERLRAEAAEAGPTRLPLVLDLRFMRTAESTRRALVLLLGAVLFVLMIAIANVLSLGVAEATRRQRELAIIATLGAGRARILGQLVAEAAILCTAGSVLGLFLAWLALAAVVPIIPERLNLITGGRPLSLGPDGVLLALVATMLSAPLVGGLTAVLGRVGGTGGLTRNASGPDRAGRRIQHGLVAVQVALSLVLLAGAGLLLESFSRLIRVDPVVAADQILLVSVRLPVNRYAGAEQRVSGVRTMADALGAVAGVRAVTATSSPLPLGRGRFRAQLEAEGGEIASLDGFLPYHEVGDGFFETLGIRILRGRTLREEDSGRDVAIVNDVLARRLWPGQSALDRRFRVAAEAPWLTVVGVSEDVPQIGYRDPEGEGMEFYVPASQQPAAWWTFALRSDANPTLLVQPARRAIWAVDPLQPIDRIVTYRAALGEDVGREKFYMVLLTCFAALATLLAAIGIHAVIAQVVLNRTREIGIRAALGAGRLRIVHAATGPGILAVGLGIVLGVAAALALTRFLESLLFGVRPGDPAILAGNVAIVLVMAALAALPPVRRALAVDPVHAIRAD
jgi:putative ABC transport system permease protein